LDFGTPGASARREVEKKRYRREQETLARHPRIGKVLLKAQSPTQAERNWATGAAGEEEIASAITRCPSVSLVCDRRMPGSRANIDLIAVAASGVWVIDPKRYRGKISVEPPLFGQPKLVINGRDRSKLVAGLDRQVTTVRERLAEFAPHAPVHGCLCFVAPEGFLAESGLPVVRQLAFSGYPLLYPRRLVKKLNADGPLTPGDCFEIASQIARRFPAA